jgi:hypothetical protein
MITKMSTALSEQEILPSQNTSMRCGYGRPKRSWAVPASPPGLCSADSKEHLTNRVQLPQKAFLVVGEIVAPTALTRSSRRRPGTCKCDSMFPRCSLLSSKRTMNQVSSGRGVSNFIHRSGKPATRIDVRSLIGLNHAGSFGFEIHCEKGLTGPNGPR